MKKTLIVSGSVVAVLALSVAVLASNRVRIFPGQTVEIAGTSVTCVQQPSGNDPYGLRQYYMSLSDLDLARAGMAGDLGQCIITYGGGQDTYGFSMDGVLISTGLTYPEVARLAREKIGLYLCKPLRDPNAVDGTTYYRGLDDLELVRATWRGELPLCTVTYNGASDGYGVIVRGQVMSTSGTYPQAATILRQNLYQCGL